MSKLLSKIAIPIVLSGLFATSVFLALYYGQLSLQFYIILLLLVTFIFSFGFSIGRNFVNPFQEILKKAKELSEGNLSARVYLKTRDELAELAASLNKIAEELQESHIDEEMIEREIEIKTKARTETLEETIKALEQKVRNRTMELENLRKESQEIENRLKEKEEEVAQLKRDLERIKLKIKEE